MRRVMMAVAVGMALAVGLLHPLWRAEWAVMDDHVNLSYIGPGGTLEWSAVPRVLGMTEGAHPAEFSRYRPLTFAPQVLEAAIIGPHAGAWYVWRTAQFAFVLGAIWWVAAAFVGAGVATLVTIYTSTHYYWTDSYAHLFVSENWAAVWFCVFAIGAERLWQWGRRRVAAPLSAASSGPTAEPTAALLLMTAGGALGAATKENLLVLLVLQALALWWAAGRTRLRPIVWAAAAVYLLLSLFITGAVLIGLRRAGNIDLYGNSVTFADRVALLMRPLPLILAAAWGALFAVRWFALRTGVARLGAEALSGWRVVWRDVLVCAALMTFVLMSQFIFYNGIWPTGGARFDFPGRLVEVAFYVALWHYGRRMAALWGWSRTFESVAPAVFALGLVGLTLRHPLTMWHAARAQLALTRAVGDSRRSIARSVAGFGDRPIVMVASDASIEEAAYSLSRELLVIERIPNPIFLDVRAVKADSSSVFAAGNVARIRRLSRDGGGGVPGRLPPSVHPWAELLARRAAGAPAPLCVRLRPYDASAVTPCPADF